MGLSIDRDEFCAADYELFAQRLQQCLRVLQRLLRSPEFGVGATTIGAELEVSIVDDRGLPLPLNRHMMADAVDPQLQLEIDRFNLEYNLIPLEIAGRSFTRLHRQLGN